jgi:hypothetical protein
LIHKAEVVWVGEAKAAGRRGKGGCVSIIFDSVELPNAEKLAILGSLTEVFSSAGGGDPMVGPEGDLKGRGPSLKSVRPLQRPPRKKRAQSSDRFAMQLTINSPLIPA